MNPAPEELASMKLEFSQAWMPIWKKLNASDRKSSDRATHAFCHQVAWEVWYAAKQTNLCKPC